MNKVFNLSKFMKKAFYDDSRGYMTQQSRAWANCYKSKCDRGMQPQEAWVSCKDEFQKSSQKAEWALNYVSQDDTGPKPRFDAKTPAAQKILKGKNQ